jgi:DNA-binding NtrC family response regulator
MKGETHMTKVLIVETKTEEQSFLSSLLQKADQSVQESHSVASALETIAVFQPEVVLIGPTFEINRGIDLAVEINKQTNRPEIVVIMEGGTVEKLLKFMNLGVSHCLNNPINNEDLLLFVQIAGEKYRLNNEKL